MKTIFSILLITMMGLGFTVNAQDDEVEEPALSISGSVDTYFRSNLNSTNNPSDLDGSFSAPATSFGNSPGFSLGMANVIISMEGEKAGFVADLVFGPRGADAVFASSPSQNIVNQMYAYWNVSDDVTFTIGNFNTFLGYEVISPTGNFNYSTSDMFSYGPFSHSGLKLDAALSDEFSLMLGVFNPTDYTDHNPSGRYLAGAQLGYSTDAGGAWLNFLLDDEFFQVDLTTGFDVSDNVYVGVNATTNDDFSGLAGYFQVSASDAFSIGLRGEYFSDNSGVAIFAGESVFDLTISANCSVGNLTLIPEFRLDSGSDDFFVDSELAPQSSLSSFILAAVYGF